MTNGFNDADQTFGVNSIAAYERDSDGTLTPIGKFNSGGLGAAFDGGEGLDPLISAYALEATADRRFLITVNAGSNSISSFRIRRDRSLRLVDTIDSGGVGPNSIAIRGRTIFVSNIDADGVFNGEPDQEGSIAGFRLTPRGRLVRLPFSRRVLDNRPSAVRFTEDGRFLVVTSINSGSISLASGSQDEVVAYRLFRFFGLTIPTLEPTDGATSTLRDNVEGRNLPSAIGFETVRSRGRDFVVVTEAREFRPDGTPPTFPTLQTGSVSVWRLTRRGNFVPVQLDVPTGTPDQSQLTACWIGFNRRKDAFWVSNALSASLTEYSFDRDGSIAVTETIAALGQPADPSDPFGTTDGWIDLSLSDDGRFLYQLYGLDGTVGVYAVGRDNSLRLVQEIETNLPDANTQGIVAF